MATAEESTPRTAAQSDGVLIVGIGASAGGQDAIERFLNHMPPDSGMAFVVVHHLTPSFDTLLVDLLAAHTKMAVHQVYDGMAIEANRVYVLPPNLDLDVMGSTFCLLEQNDSHGRQPIDYFFRSLARDRKARAVGIVLSGAGTDGSLGLTAIKEYGGMVLAQEPKSATWDSMPRSAIATGMVDFVLPPQEMPDRILAYAWHPYAQAPQAILANGAREWLTKIFILVRSETGHDFSRYRSATMGRRIERRMALHEIKRIEDYYRYLQANPKELGTLFRELLVSVTTFFRDPEAFDVLRQSAIRPLLQRRSAGDPLRVWVPGCASGEEAYSIAMLLTEQAEELKQDVKLQIFGSDLDGEALDRARQGYYPAGIAGSLGQQRLQRFFTCHKDSYRVNEHLRSLVLFAAQSLIKDPPFSRLDLISCRNVLIYLDPGLQKEVLAMFQYALKPGGFLFLGTSETAEANPKLFEAVDRKQKLFQKLGASPRLAGPAALPVAVEKAAWRHAAAAPGAGLRHAVEKMLLDQAPTSVAIDRGGEILFVHGRTGAYLEVPAGQGVPSNLFLLAREGLKTPLAYLVQRAADRKERIVHDRAQVRNNGATLNIRLAAAPLPDAHDTGEAFLVQFEQVESEPGCGELEGETQALREELQSIKEELTTLNAGHEARIEQLLRAQADLENTLTQVEIGVIFLDRDLNIRHFNSAATHFANLIPTDVGRPLGHIVSKIKYAELLADARAAIELTMPKEVEVESVDGRWYVMRILPNRTSHNFADGVTLTFTEVTEQKEAERILRSRAELLDLEAGRFDGVVRDSCNAITVQSLDGRIVAWNRAAEKTYGWSRAEALTLYARDLIPEDKREEAVEVARKLANGEVVAPFRTRRTDKHGRQVEIWLTVCPLLDAGGRQYATATTERETCDMPPGTRCES